MQTKYTVVRADGKWWVMEYMQEPKKKDFYFQAEGYINYHLDDFLLAHEEWSNRIKFSIQLPTLPEHFDYWSKLEGKIIEEGKFEKTQIKTGGRSIKSAEGIPYDYEEYFTVYAIPKQEDLWELPIKEAYQFAIGKEGQFCGNVIWMMHFQKYLKDNFTITRK